MSKMRGLEDGLNDLRKNFAQHSSQPKSIPEPKYSASTVVKSNVPHKSLEQAEMVKVYKIFQQLLYQCILQVGRFLTISVLFRVMPKYGKLSIPGTKNYLWVQIYLLVALSLFWNLFKVGVL